MSTKYSPSLSPLDVELFPSLILRALLAALALPAWAAIVLSALPVTLKIALGLMVAGYLALQWRRHGGCRGGLRWDGAGWWWRDARGEVAPLQLRGATLWPGLLVLDFRAADGGGWALVLLPDSAAADELRRLRAVLHHFEVYGESGVG